VRHRATRRFWDRYRALGPDVQHLADAAYELLKTDSKHPSLPLKTVGKYWSVRVGLHYRALAIQEDHDLVWFWIGHHSEYDRLVASH
jgi:predicted metal-dependent hydrolase